MTFVLTLGAPGYAARFESAAATPSRDADADASTMSGGPLRAAQKSQAAQDSAAAKPAQSAGPANAATERPTDAVIEPYQSWLLDLAYDSALLMPAGPHGSERNRMLEDIVTACIRLDQSIRARAFLGGMTDWRQGVAAGDLAFHYAERGHMDEVPALLRIAERAASRAEDWRRDRIRVRMARVHALLGDEQQARALETDVEPAEAGKVDQVRAESFDAAAVEQQLEFLRTIAAQSSFDHLRNVLDACVVLYDRFFTDSDLRRRIDEEMRKAWSARIPVQIRIELLDAMADRALGHGDLVTARKLADDAEQEWRGSVWNVEYGVPLGGRLMALRHRVGDADGARALGDFLLSMFDEQKHTVPQMFRAAALRPVAEAYAQMGDRDVAMELYRRLVEEGAVNRNARPRTLDLVATCLSLAVHRFEPDAALWERLREIRSELRDPW